MIAIVDYQNMLHEQNISCYYVTSISISKYIAYHYNNNSYHILKNNYVRLTKKYIIKVIGVAELLYESVFQSII